MQSLNSLTLFATCTYWIWCIILNKKRINGDAQSLNLPLAGFQQVKTRVALRFII